MIGICDCEVQAANPSMPLYPLRAYLNSPSSLRIRNVPKKIGDWNITSVQLVAAYPDNTIKTANCKLIGCVWVGTIAGSTATGTSENGYTIYASGIDENGNEVNDYVLGKGLIEILATDGSITPGETVSYMHLLSAEPSEPKYGDVWPSNEQYMIWQDGAARPLGITQSQMQLYVTEAISGKLDVSAYHGDYIRDASGNIIRANLDIAHEEPLDAGWKLSRYGENYVLTPKNVEEWTANYKIWRYEDEVFSFELSWNGANWYYVMYEYGSWYDDQTIQGQADDTTLVFASGSVVFSRPLSETGRLATVSQLDSAISGKADASDLRYAMAAPGGWEFSGSGVQEGVVYTVDMVYNALGENYRYILLADGTLLDDNWESESPAENYIEYPLVHITAIRNRLLDRAINNVEISSVTTLTIPEAVNGKARDFLLRVTIPSGTTVAGLITFAGYNGEPLTYETDDDSFPEPDDVGTWLYSFTETTTHTFAVSLKPVTTVTQRGNA